MMQKRLVVKGRVQDVDYRETVKDIARSMNVFGEVRNLRNGTVEILCGCDDKKHFEEFKDKITIKEQSHYKPFVEKIDEYPEDLKLNVFTVDYGDVQTQLLKKTIVGSKAMKDMSKQMKSMNDSMKSMNENLGNKIESGNKGLGNKMDSMNENLGNKMDSMNTEMKLMNNNLGEKIDVMNNNITNRFDTMEQKYDIIGETMIKLEKHFGKLVEEFIGKKKK